MPDPHAACFFHFIVRFFFKTPNTKSSWLLFAIDPKHDAFVHLFFYRRSIAWRTWTCSASNHGKDYQLKRPLKNKCFVFFFNLLLGEMSQLFCFNSCVRKLIVFIWQWDTGWAWTNEILDLTVTNTIFILFQNPWELHLFYKNLVAQYIHGLC